MRLTDKQKAEVIRDYACGKSQTEIAKKLKISDAAVSKILKAEKVKLSEKKLNPKLKLNKTQKEMSDEIVEKATVALLEKNYVNPAFSLWWGYARARYKIRLRNRNLKRGVRRPVLF